MTVPKNEHSVTFIDTSKKKKMPSRDSFLTDCGLRYETIVYLSDESNTPFNDVYAAFLFLYCAKLNVMSTFMSLNRVKG